MANLRLELPQFKTSTYCWGMIFPDMSVV